MATRAFAITVPAETSSLRSLRAFLASVLEGSGCPDTEPLVLAVDEACANLIRHRCATIEDGQIRVGFEIGDGAIRFRIGRFCVARDLGKIKPRDLRDVKPGGLGTSFIAQIMDRVDYEEEPGQPGCLALVMEKGIGKP